MLLTIEAGPSCDAATLQPCRQRQWHETLERHSCRSIGVNRPRPSMLSQFEIQQEATEVTEKEEHF